MTLKGTLTEKYLLTAFAGESQARNRYSFFAKKAKDEGYVQIARIFEETADQEQAHAKRFFRFLEGGDAEYTATFPAGMIGTTSENLAAAAAGERLEWSTLYPSFAATARDEGFETIAKAFESIMVAETHHERRYRGLLSNLVTGTLFRKEKPITWRCLNCGYLHEGTEALQACPACLHPQAYFEMLAINW